MRNARSNEEENQEEEKNTNIIEKFNTLEQKTVFFQKMSTKNVILKVRKVLCVCVWVFQNIINFSYRKKEEEISRILSIIIIIIMMIR